MSIDLKNKMKNNITSNNEVSVLNTSTDKEKNNNNTKTFKLGKKVDEKKTKKSFPVYMDVSLQKELDKICKKTDYSRNELINLMCCYCVENLELLD